MRTGPESKRERSKASRAEQRAIDEAAMASFPASDAPPWTAMHAGAPRTERAPVGPPSDVRARVVADVFAIGTEIGERTEDSLRGRVGIARAAEYVSSSLLEAGYSVTRVPVPGARLSPLENFEVILRPASSARGEIVVGAHYDTVVGSALATEDASGVAILLAVARLLAKRRFARPVRFIAFANEQSPFAHARCVGSRVHAARLRRQGVRVEAMIALASLGTRGPLALVGNLRSRHVVREAVQAFRSGTRVPIHGLALPGFLPLVSSSDPSSFWAQGFPAAMLTDGGPLRSWRRRTAEDVDPDQLAEVVFGTAAMVSALAGSGGDTREAREGQVRR
jgi:hypothetical protein